MAKREPRNKIKKAQLDFFIPIDILTLGGPDDPCFGKLHDISTPECGRCGDSELCSIKMMQTMKGVRGKEEKTKPFKDQEEVYIQVENYLKSKMPPGTKFKVSMIVSKVKEKFMIPSDKEALKLVIKTYKFSGKFKKENEYLTWKS